MNLDKNLKEPMGTKFKQHSLPQQNGLSFFRYSKLCLLEWTASVALFVYGFYTQTYFTFIGLALFFAFPVLNEMVLNIVALG